MKKRVFLDPRVKEDFEALPRKIQKAFTALFKILEEKGALNQPDAKKISGHKNLFELRVRMQGQWRAFYCYLKQDKIVIVHVIHKKRQKTEVTTLQVALKRIRDYKEML